MSGTASNKYGDMYQEFTAYCAPRQVTIYRNGKEWMRISRRVAGGDEIAQKATVLVEALNLAAELENTKTQLHEYKRDSVMQQDELSYLRLQVRWLKQLVETQAASLENVTRSIRDGQGYGR